MPSYRFKSRLPHVCEAFVDDFDSHHAVESGRKRARCTSQHSSQTQLSPAEQAERDLEVMQGIARSLGTRAKDLLTLLGLLRIDFVSPQHVQAFLVSIPDLDSEPSSYFSLRTLCSDCKVALPYYCRQEENIMLQLVTIQCMCGMIALK